MSYFVGYHIGHGEIALNTETRFNFSEKTNIQIYLVVHRTIERYARLGESAGGLNRLSEQNQFGRLVPALRPSENILPDDLGIGQHYRDKIFEFVVNRWFSWVTALLRKGTLMGLDRILGLKKRPWIKTEKHPQQVHHSKRL
jgi:hypothetical protein